MISIELLQAREREARCRQNLARAEADLVKIRWALSGRGDVSVAAFDLGLSSGLKDPDGDRVALEKKKVALTSSIEDLNFMITDAADAVRILETTEPEREAGHHTDAERAAILATDLEQATIAVHGAMTALREASIKMRTAFVGLLAVDFPPSKIDPTGEPVRENFAPTTYVTFVADIDLARTKALGGTLLSHGAVRPSDGHDFAWLADRWSDAIRHKIEKITKPKPAKAAHHTKEAA